ncbi:MAG: PD-(D/E)XK nuclease family transposase [Clostridia bacterium]|nr:PD-(D/E)XK nuclease family transposase [Clostridia bacterium]
MANESLADNRTVKNKTKDSVFTTLFKDVNNVYTLYRELHPEDTTTTVNDIQIETLETVLINEIYNDLGFIVNSGEKAKFVILVEAQSRWTDNMTLRMLFYISETYRRYLKETEQSEHLEKRVFLPKPEMYVVYTGSKKISDEVSFSETYFDGDSSLDLRVKVLRQVEKNTLHGQYIGFSRVYDEQRRLYSNKLECIKETIRICIEEGYLTEFLDQHKQEVTTMLSELFDEQAQREQYDKAIRKESEERGVLKTLVSLFKKGLLTLSEASKQADMSEKEFEDLVVSMP